MLIVYVATGQSDMSQRNLRQVQAIYNSLEERKEREILVNTNNITNSSEAMCYKP